MYSNKTTSNNYEYEKLKHNSLLEDYIIDIGLGSKDAFIKFYELTKSCVYGFALSILKNKHDAEDVLQEVYIKVYENAGFYQANGKPLAWIITITKNLSLMKLRKEKYNKNLDDLNEIIADENKEDVITRLLLNEVFLKISMEERNILILHAVSGFKHKEIAKMLEMPLSTVLSKYNRTIKKLRKIMSEDGVK